MRERMLRGGLYIADDADNAREFGRVQVMLADFNGAAPGAWDQRDALLRRMLRVSAGRGRALAVLLRVRSHHDRRADFRQR